MSGGGKGGLRFTPGTLRSRLRATAARALREGALQPVPTSFGYIEEGGIRFLVRVLSSLARKDEERWRREREARAKGEEVNPFLPYERALFVADLNDTHLCLLNKFNVVDEHLLIVTRRFEDQDEYPNERDFAALLLGLREYEGLAFYNGGVTAGASQRHKHLQLVPLPLAPLGPPVPVDPAISASRFRGGVGWTDRLPFLHAVARLDRRWVLRPLESAARVKELFGELLLATGMEGGAPAAGVRQSGPYNLLVTREWMLLVPRSEEFFDGVSVNSLGFAGALLVRSEEQMTRLRERGPLGALRSVAFPEGQAVGWGGSGR